MKPLFHASVEIVVVLLSVSAICLSEGVIPKSVNADHTLTRKNVRTPTEVTKVSSSSWKKDPSQINYCLGKFEN